MTERVLTVSELRVAVGRREIVHGLGFAVDAEQTLGIVGESGSGKTMTLLGATGLLDAPGARVSGSSLLRTRSGDETELVGASARQLRRVHGGEVGFVFQDPGASLNPLLTLGRQLSESLEAHRGFTARTARTRSIELLEAVGLPDPEARLRSYPHQLSGGQRQRVMIAIALSCDPALLVADEPTTALDVTTQAQIIDLVRVLQRDHGTAVIWVSHDLGVVGEIADDVLVLRHGDEIERAPVTELFAQPRADYTRMLIEARPRLVIDSAKLPDPPDVPSDRPPVLDVENLDVRFSMQTPSGPRSVHAVSDVSFAIPAGRTLGIVGESGSGKSTIARTLTGLTAPTSGTIRIDGEDLAAATAAHRRVLRRRLSMVFQDPFTSLNGRIRVGVSLGEPLRLLPRFATDRRGRERRAAELLDLVGLPPAFAERYPHELSGGERQRVSIARALALEPELVILDEATASLDVSIQAAVLGLLKELQRELGIGYLFIGHDLAVVQQLSHEVLVLQRGRIVEHRPTYELFSAAASDYTRALIAAVPQPPGSGGSAHEADLP